MPWHDVHKAWLRARERAVVWTYLVSAPTAPSGHYPISQSYLDVILAACLRYGIAFAMEFVRSTGGWQSAAWLDERCAPRYVRRDFESPPDAAAVDAVLRHTVPHSLTRRRSQGSPA